MPDKHEVASSSLAKPTSGELAQLGEHLPCTQGVSGSSPLFSTMACPDKSAKLLFENWVYNRR